MFIPGRIFQMGLIIFMFVVAIFSYYYSKKKASEGKTPFGGIRPLDAMDHLEEGVARSVEMGKKVHMTLGMGDFTDSNTNPLIVAGLNILGNVAEICGKLEVPLIVTIAQSVVVPIAKGVIRDGFGRVGRPELYNDDIVRYASEDQFAYSANSAAIIMRENVGTNIMAGYFFDEDIIVAETGVRAGCYQIGGNKMIFVVTCEYFMLGEELFAAGAYISKDPALVGSIAQQDISKGLLLGFLILGVILSYFGVGIISTIMKM